MARATIYSGKFKVETLGREAGQPAADPVCMSVPINERLITTDQTSAKVTLFASLDVATRSSASACRAIVTRNSSSSCGPSTGPRPRRLDLHLIADNYVTHKHPTARAWPAKHPRFHMHFTPTSASWLN